MACYFTLTCDHTFKLLSFIPAALKCQLNSSDKLIIFKISNVFKMYKINHDSIMFLRVMRQRQKNSQVEKALIADNLL